VTPFFQVVFNFNNRAVQSAPVSMPGLVTSAIPVNQAAVKFDLVLDMQERERGLTGTMTYNASVFDAATIEKLMRCYEALLKHVAAHPDTRLDELKALLAQAEKQDESLKRREFRETRRRMFKHITARSGPRAGMKGDEEL
jgi:non-ribosomal peptide synthetase component F